MSTNFDVCKIRAQSEFDTIESNPSLKRYFYDCILAHFSNTVARPLVLTLDGCKHYCSNGPETNNTEKALIILATWILPGIGLISQLPFESMSVGKVKNFWALVAWIGTPASCLTAFLFNMHATKKAADNSPDRDGLVIDCYYVLSCLNQYEYYPLKHDRMDDNTESLQGPQLAPENAANGPAVPLIEMNGTTPRTYRSQLLKPFERTLALTYGLLRPSIQSDGEFQVASAATLSQLAHQLRMLRRCAVWTLVASAAWFVIASGISVGTAFGNLEITQRLIVLPWDCY